MKNPNDERLNGLFNRFDQLRPHPDELKRDIIDLSIYEEFKKNQFIVRPGETSRYCYFIIDGFVRLYHDYKEKEVTTWFLHTNDFMIQQHGFYFGLESPEYLQAIEDTVCLKLHKDKLNNLYKKYPFFKDTYTELTEIYYFQITQREAWKAYSAKDHFKKLLDEYPYIIQKAPNAHVASYMGISESHYCKIKNGRL